MDEILKNYKPRHTYQHHKYWYEVNPPKLSLDSNSMLIEKLFNNTFNKKLSESELNVITSFIKPIDDNQIVPLTINTSTFIVAFNYIWPNYGDTFLELSIRNIIDYVDEYVLFLNKYSYIGVPCSDEQYDSIINTCNAINSPKIKIIKHDTKESCIAAAYGNVPHHFSLMNEMYLNSKFTHIWMVQSDEIYSPDVCSSIVELCKSNSFDNSLAIQCQCYLETPCWKVTPVEHWDRPSVAKIGYSFDYDSKILNFDLYFTHYSYVLTSYDLSVKLSNWGHRMDVKRNNVIDTFDKLKSNKRLQNLHPIFGHLYKSVEFDSSDSSQDNFKFWLKFNCKTIQDVLSFISTNLISQKSNIVINSQDDIKFDTNNHNSTLITEDYDEYIYNTKHNLDNKQIFYGSTINAIQMLDSESVNMFIHKFESYDVIKSIFNHTLINILTKISNFGWYCCIYKTNSIIQQFLNEFTNESFHSDEFGQSFIFGFNEISHQIVIDGEFTISIFRINLDNSRIKNIESNNVYFGPFIGEFGWELSRWAPMVNKFVHDNPNVNVVVGTSKFNQGLYPDVQTFDLIESPECGRNGFVNNEINPTELGQLLYTIYNTYKDFKIVIPNDFSNSLNPFPKEDYLINYEPSLKFLDVCLSQIGNKIPIAIHSRHIEGKSRNWNISNWYKLFKLIDDSKQFFCFIIGKSPSIIRCDNLDSFFNVEDLAVLPEDTIPAMISALKCCKLTISQQSSLAILSQYVETPTLMFGHRKYRNMNFDNPKNVKKRFIDDPNYEINPNRLFEEIKQFIEII